MVSWKTHPTNLYFIKYDNLTYFSLRHFKHTIIYHNPVGWVFQPTQKLEIILCQTTQEYLHKVMPTSLL